MRTHAKLSGFRLVKNLGKRTRRVILGAALVSSLGGAALSMPASASAAVTPGATATAQPSVSYGESAAFHCARGSGYAVVFFDKLSVPYAELQPAGSYTLYYEPVVYIYYQGAWRSYSLIRTSSNFASENGLRYWHVNSPGQEVYDELQFVADVPLGYAYRVYVYVDNTNPRYSTPHYDPALSWGGGTSYVCTAAE